MLLLVRVWVSTMEASAQLPAVEKEEKPEIRHRQPRETKASLSRSQELKFD